MPDGGGARIRAFLRLSLSYGGRVDLVLPPRTRMTPQRRAVLDAIGERTAAFTAVEVYDRARGAAPGLGLATVYRTIELLRRTGSLRPLSGSGKPVYVRCRPGHHHHLVCVSCGTVEETELCGAPPDAELRRLHGFRAEAHELDVYGVCRGCSGAAA